MWKINKSNRWENQLDRRLAFLDHKHRQRHILLKNANWVASSGCQRVVTSDNANHTYILLWTSHLHGQQNELIRSTLNHAGNTCNTSTMPKKQWDKTGDIVVVICYFATLLFCVVVKCPEGPWLPHGQYINQINQSNGWAALLKNQNTCEHHKLVTIKSDPNSDLFCLCGHALHVSSASLQPSW